MDNQLFDYPVDGVLDLHMFKPNEVKSALEEYLFQCRIAGVLYVRIIHGKGHGVIRQIVRSFLKNCSYVKEFQNSPDSSNWGATVAVLEPLDNEETEEKDKT